MEKWIHRALFKIQGGIFEMVEDGVENPFITKQVIFQEYSSQNCHHYLFYTLLFPKNKKEN